MGVGWTEVEFLDLLGTSKSFPPYNSQSPVVTGVTPPSTPPPPPNQKWVKTLYTETSSLSPETSTNLYVHEFGFWKGSEIYEEEGRIAGISSLFYWFSKIPEGDDLFPPFWASIVILPHGQNN